MSRIIVQNNEVGLKSVNDIARYWPEIPGSEPILSRRDAWDVGTLAIATDYQSPMSAGLIGLGLYQSAVRLAQHSNIGVWISLLDRLVRRMTRWKYHSPFQAIPGAIAKPYLGSGSTLPTYSDLTEWDAHLRAKDPTMHETIYAGVGIEAALSPLDISNGVALIRDLTTASPR